MTEPALNEAQRREVEQTAELTTRRYFDHYLENVWPKQAAELERQCNHNIQHHDEDPHAHGAVPRRFNRLMWIGVGIAAASGTGGAGLAQVLMNLAG
jgi:hypothetical protein